jgi:N-dimethylarginine dimethylaminohydrolase
MRVSLCRRTTHAFVRPPNFRSIPSAGPNGVIVNRELLNHQFRDFYKTLQQSTMIDKLHVMSERQSFDSMRVADQMISIGPMTLGMPLAGIEHRATEFMETMRYIRAAGGPSTVASYLQDLDSCRCHTGDIVCLPAGIAVAQGPRTNATAQQTLKQLFEIKDEAAPFGVFPLEQEGDAPPLGDYFGFAGTNLLIVWKDEHGMLAVDQFQAQNPGQQLQVVYLEPGCHFLSFYGTESTNDILVQRGYDRSLEALTTVGLNPIPVQWSEMEKMGVSMRSAVLLIRIVRNQAGNNFATARKNRLGRWQAHQLQQSMPNPHPPPSA